MNRTYFVLEVLAASLLWTTVAGAAPLAVSSYDMLNGHGTASGGTYNYWDLSYTGAGATSTDNAPLTGGLGDLTDGVVANMNWHQIEVAAGTGPYVGWRSDVLAQAAVVFRFANPSQIDAVTVYVDDADGNGGVSPPLSVDVGPEGGPYANFPTPDLIGDAPTSYTFSNLGLIGSAVELRFNYANTWVFVSEVSIEGTEIPEPALAATLSAMAALAMVIRKRRKRRLTAT